MGIMTETTKLIYLHTSDLIGSSPSNTYLVNNVLGFAAQGIEVEVIHVKRSEEPAKALIKDIYGIDMPRNVSFESIDSGSRSNRSFYLKALSIVRANSGQRAVVYTRALHFLPHYFKSNEELPPLFYESHDFYLEPFRRDDVSFTKKIKRYLLEKKYLRKTKAIVCVSAEQARLYKKHLKQIPIKAIPSGIIRNPEQVGQSAEKYAVYVGSLDPHKGLSNITSCASLLPRGVSIKLVGAKGPSEKEKLERDFESKGLDEKIEVFEWQNKEDLKKTLKGARLGLLPLAETFFNRYLTMPLKLLDYLSMGLPTLGTDFPSYGYIIEKSGAGLLIKDWNDHERIKRFFKEIFESEECFERYKKAAREAAKKIPSWSDRAKLQLDFINNVLASEEKIRDL